MAKRDVGSSLSVERCMQCGVGGNKKLVRQLRKPQTIKEKDIYPGVCKKRHQAMQTNKKLVRQLRNPQTIKQKEKDMSYRSLHCKEKTNKHTNKQKACPTAQETTNY